MKLIPMLLIGLTITAASSGCSLVPETRSREPIHNPFPQLKRVAVLPFFNQSGEPTVDVNLVAEKYYAALQAVPGFEVLPVGVAQNQWRQYAMLHGEPRSGPEFQKLAQMMGVEAIVVGSVTDFQSYYPPRMAMTVHWYAANEGFHEIPAGYGLPWGTEQEKQIPARIAREAEFELARSQLATQTPVAPVATDVILNQHLSSERRQAPSSVQQAGHQGGSNDDPFHEDYDAFADHQIIDGEIIDGMETSLPSQWPDPTDLIPDPPSPVPPPSIANHAPVLSHTRIYRGDDAYFTGRLENYVETGDDARGNGWQGYLKRTDDFVHFCCHLHITEMLESRGGRDQSEFIVRWPLSRY